MLATLASYCHSQADQVVVIGWDGHLGKSRRIARGDLRQEFQAGPQAGGAGPVQEAGNPGSARSESTTETYSM